MNISSVCNLVLSNLYGYDFSACAYNILKSINWDLSEVEFENKEKRNIQIGYIQRNNPNVANFLLNSINNLVDHYFNVNGISKENVIIRMRDGFIIDKPLNIIDITMPIDLRTIYSKIILSYDRSKCVGITNNGYIEVKGIRNKTLDISFFNMFKNLNFSTQKSLMVGLENIRKTILSSENIEWFMRVNDEESYIVPIMNTGLLKLNKASLRMVDIDEIDKYFIWEEYIWPFARSILIHCHSR